jgi:GNAT superfamily N-acetyltransferase
VKANIIHECPVRTSGRLLQMAGMFDLPIEDKTRLEINAYLPIEDQPWHVGLIVGPSGSGKSSIARHLWPTQLTEHHTWPPDAALLDGFSADMSTNDVVGLLTAVGLGSPPAWVRPYRTLSGGEAFRADVARSLAEAHDDLVVIDEFTSVVDRQVARVASHAIQKTVRRSDRQLIAVTCHYDITDWLQPDWTYDVSTAEFSWRSVQPHPQLDLEIYPVDRSAWPMFRRHHYLSADIHRAAQCFGAWIGNQLVAFAAIRHFPHAHTRNIKMGHRLVVLPDYQGLGIGGRLDDWIGQYLWDRKLRYRNVVAHPAMIAYYSASPRWHENNRSTTNQTGKRSNKNMQASQSSTRRLVVRSFEYRAPKKET